MNKSFSASINLFWLDYYDKEISKQYNDNNMQLQGKLFVWIGYLHAIIFGGVFLLCLILDFDLQIIISSGIFSLIQIIVQIFSRKFPWLIQINPIICLCFYQWFFIEQIFFQYLQNQIGSHQELGKMYFYFGAGYFFVCSLQVYMINSWVVKELYVLVVWEYFIFRAFEFQKVFFFIPVHFSLLVLMPILLYQIDKFNKKNFFNFFQQQLNQKELQCQIIQQTSSALFITKIHEQQLTCLFANSNCKSELQIFNENEVIERLKYLTVTSEKKGPNKQENVKLEEIIYQLQKQLQVENCQEDLDQQPLFHQLDCKLQYPANFNCQSNISIKGRDGNPKEKYFFVKLMECFWEQKKVIMTILEDISDQVMNTRLQEVDKYKDNLLASVTHDLKTPINCIISISKSAMEAKDEVTMRNCLEAILQNAQLQKYLINDILDFSQYKNNKLKINISDFSISELAQEVVDMFKDQSFVKNIQINLKMKNFQNFGLGGKGDIVSSDSCRVKQILINLISNAFKYTLRGSISIMIERMINQQETQHFQEDSSSIDLAQQQEILKISVEDTGVGIPEEIQGQLFQLYGTFNHSSKQLNRNGIGLGLTICKKLVKILGPYKKVFFKSQVDVGTTFTFFIYSNLRKLNSASNPIIQINKKSFICISNNQIVDNKDVLSPEFNEFNDQKQQIKVLTRQYKKKEQIEKSQANQMNMLIVDDNIYNIQAVKVMMQKYSQFKIYQATNGQEALNIFTQHTKEGLSPFYLVLTDIQMPIMDGIELMQRIRALERELDIPKTVIAVITADDSKDLKFFQDLGADYNINKPVDAQQLNSLLNMIQAL